jgi:hypothetical protein
MAGFEPALDKFFAPKKWRVIGVRLVHIRSGDVGEAAVEVDGVRVGNIRFSEDRDEATIHPMPPEVRRVGEELYAAIDAYFCGKRWSLCWRSVYAAKLSTPVFAACSCAEQ